MTQPVHSSLAILLLAAVNCRGGAGPLQLEVLNQPSSPADLPGTLKLTEGATLNLTCRVAPGEGGAGEPRLAWYLPNPKPSGRLEQSGRGGASTLIISPVIETDTGDYECWADSQSESGAQVKKTLKVLIEPRRGSCQPGQYQCESPEQYCIATRYRCDSHDDCPGGDDEAPLLCGHEPCKGKITCPELDFRCIDPTEYCCDPGTDPDCTFMYPCCEAVMEFSVRSRLAQQYQLTTGEEAAVHPADLAYFHSTVYTIIGCAVAFLVILLALGLAVCRLHLLRKAGRGRGAVRGAGRQHPPITLHDLDIYFSERGGQQEVELVELQPAPHIGITYNINHGVQILGQQGGQGAAPPPYSTEPRRGRGPPPPYRSSEHLPAAAPLLQEDDNNNGDINGNSEMVDNNAREAVEGGAGGVAGLVAPDRASPPPRYPGLDRGAGGGAGGGYSSTDTDTD